MCKRPCAYTLYSVGGLQGAQCKFVSRYPATQEITTGMNEMAAGAEQVNDAVNSVNELSGRNRENIDSLVQAVSQFKV